MDVVISSLVDVYYNFSTSPTGLSLFVAITGVLVAGTYIILKMTERSIREHSMKETYDNRITKAVWTVYYLMIAILIFVILQLLFFSEYYTALLSIAPTISYGLSAFLMILLAYHFFSWFVRNRSLIVLLYGLASVSTSAYVCLIAVIFYVEIFIHQPAVTTLESSASFPPIEPGLEEILIITLPGILSAITFLSFWGGTIAILYTNIKRIGKTIFWILVTTPIIFFLGTLISLFPFMQEIAKGDDLNSIVIPLYVSVFSAIIAIVLFAIAFVYIARAIPHHRVSDYMYITCFGLVLFSIGTIATISGAGYPPFGLPTVSLVGPFSFLLFIGLYRSAISIAADSDLLRSIKVSAQQELKLLDNIGSAERERKLEKTVLEITKSNAYKLRQQTGIEPSISIDEAKEYLYEVMDKTKGQKK